MGILRRIMLIMRGYISSASDKIERAAAEEELREAKARKAALEELDLAGLGLPRRDSRVSAPISATPPYSPEKRRLAADYRLLGVAPGSELAVVEAAWRELARRADPKRFPAGSAEERKAAEILESVNEAYARIREALNPTEGRFGRLEL